MSRVASLATVAAILACPAAAVAQHAPEPVPADVRSDFWRQVSQPRHRRSRTLLSHALRRIEDFEQPPPGLGPAQRRAILEGAIHRLELAHRITPEDPEILFLLAQSKARWVRRTPAGVEERLDDEAIELFQRLRARDPDYEAQDVAFQLGVLFTRQRRFEEAAAEYRRSIDQELILDSRESATAWNNLAEVTMLGGDVQRSVEYYERAIELYRRNGLNDVLSLWGLAVALDRLGEHRSAMDRAREALSHGSGSMAILHSEEVFFEPAYELYWYEALGNEALADMEGDETQRRRYLQAARTAWDLFLRESAGESRWEDIARRHAERIDQRLGR